MLMMICSRNDGKFMGDWTTADELAHSKAARIDDCARVQSTEYERTLKRAVEASHNVMRHSSDPTGCGPTLKIHNE